MLVLDVLALVNSCELIEVKFTEAVDEFASVTEIVVELAELVEVTENVVVLLLLVVPENVE